MPSAHAKNSKQAQAQSGWYQSALLVVLLACVACVLDARVNTGGAKRSNSSGYFLFLFSILCFLICFFFVVFLFLFLLSFLFAFLFAFFVLLFSLDCKKGSKRLIVFLFVCDLHLFFLQCLFIYFFTLVVLATYSVSVF